MLVNSAITFSGGIQNCYFTDLIRLLSSAKTPIPGSSLSALHYYSILKISDQLNSVPSPDELFTILKFATDMKNIVGCYTTNVRH